jgi:hypothetical protein
MPAKIYCGKLAISSDGSIIPNPVKPESAATKAPRLKEKMIIII